MAEDEKYPNHADNQRGPAGEKAAVMREGISALSPEAMRQLLQELQERQIALVMQNEQLKRSLDAACESKKRFRQMFMNAPVPYQSLDENGNFLEVNQTFLLVMGYTREELIGKNFGDLLHPDSTENFRENFPRFKAIGEVAGVEFEMLKKDGASILVSFNGKIQRNEQGDFQRTHCVFQDITERKQADASLKWSEEKHKKLIDNISDVIAIIGDNGMIRYKSPNIEKWFGWQPEDLVGTDGWATVHPDDLERIQAEFFKLLENIGSQKTVLYRYKCKDGGYKWIELTAVNLIDDPIIHGVLTNYRDITDRKRAEAQMAELETQNRQLQKAESLGRMAGAIAHHFNNQLQVVMGNLEMAMDDMARVSTPSEILSEALKAARKVAQVSSLMLTYRGQMPGKKAPLDFSEVCRQSLPLLEAATPKGMVIKTVFPCSGPIVRANAGQIQQVLGNLFTNAREACGENKGSLGLTVKTVSRADIPASNRFPIDWQPQGITYACLEVTDTGCGIHNREIEKVFDPFFTTKFTGRGLGLPVVIGIVLAHGGCVTVESELCAGSVFRVFLPVSADAIPGLPEYAGKSSETKRGGTVLLVEDEAQVRNMVNKMLTHLGHNVLEARDGFQALAVFRQHRDEICCVICDLTMPGMNGWETMAALRKLSPCIPVILSSGYDEAHVLAEAHPDRPDAFLGKPYQRKWLSEAMRQALTDKTKTV